MTDERYAADYEGVVQVVEHLLGPDGCPWDKKQTREIAGGYVPRRVL